MPAAPARTTLLLRGISSSVGAYGIGGVDAWLCLAHVVVSEKDTVAALFSSEAAAAAGFAKSTNCKYDLTAPHPFHASLCWL